jgi:hypothetical protein
MAGGAGDERLRRQPVDICIDLWCEHFLPRLLSLLAGAIFIAPISGGRYHAYPPPLYQEGI